MNNHDSGRVSRKDRIREELDLFQGEILGLGGGADFDGKSINTLAQEALQERVGH